MCLDQKISGAIECFLTKIKRLPMSYMALLMACRALSRAYRAILLGNRALRMAYIDCLMA